MSLSLDVYKRQLYHSLVTVKIYFRPKRPHAIHSRKDIHRGIKIIGIGVVTAALGAATVASAGQLPLAIGLGTAMLVELAESFIIVTESLIAVANELGDNLAPALDRLNDKLPTLSTNMSEFVDFMTD